MTNNVINLREKPVEKLERDLPYLDRLEATEEKNFAMAATAPDNKKAALFSWTAQEYEARPRGQNWFITIGGITLILIVFGIYTKSFFFSIFIALASIILMVYIKRGPQKTGVLITSDGVFVGRSFFDFKNLKSFWIFEKQDPQELSLKTQKILTPFLRLPLKDVEVEKLKEILLRFLPEEEHPELVSDQIARSLGL